MGKLTVLTSALVILFGPLLQVSAVRHGQEGPTEVKRKSFMETSFTISNDGTLSARTRTWSRRKLSGFTGGVFIVLLDDQNNRLWNSQQHRYGVNGRWLGKSDRTEVWTEKIPTAVLPRVHAAAVVHQHTPTNRVWKWIAENGPKIISLIKVING